MSLDVSDKLCFECWLPIRLFEENVDGLTDLESIFQNSRGEDWFLHLWAAIVQFITFGRTSRLKKRFLYFQNTSELLLCLSLRHNIVKCRRSTCQRYNPDQHHNHHHDHQNGWIYISDVHDQDSEKEQRTIYGVSNLGYCMQQPCLQIASGNTSINSDRTVIIFCEPSF